MYIKNIHIKDFRNYKDGFVEFYKGTNVIYGRNARGKTNILEAIYMCATSKSHRGAKEKDMIKYDVESAHISTSFFAHRRYNQILLKMNAGQKNFYINKVMIDKTSDLLGSLYCVIFCPEDLKIIKGSPRIRRQMMDSAICFINPGYVNKIIKYNKILNHRNMALKNSSNDEALWVWDAQLASVGAGIMEQRNRFLQQLNSLACVYMKNIAGEFLEIEYKNIFHRVSESEDKSERITFYQNLILEEIEKNRDREKRWGQSLIGPHRDDFVVKIDEKEARSFASQGQVRSAVLSMKLAETECIRTFTGEAPILLLDDVLSELDEERQKYILNEFLDLQIIITATEAKQYKGQSGVKMINVDGIERGK